VTRFRLVAGVCAVALMIGGMSLAEDPPVKYKGQLPAGWRKLGLSDRQVQDIYKIQTDYRTKIGKLQAQIQQLREEERAKMHEVLTPTQRERLKEIRGGEPLPKKEVAKEREAVKDKK